MINLVLGNKIFNEKQVIYAFYYLLKRYCEELSISYNKKDNAINIFYGIEPCLEKGIYIPAETYNKKSIKFNSFNELSYMTFTEVDCPFKIENESIIFNFDILSLSFYLISCNEEYEILNRDDKDRFLADYSFRKEKITEPYFDINSELLFRALKYINTDIHMPKKKFEIFLTHDVDSVNSQNLYVFLHNVKELVFNRNKKISRKFIDTINDLTTNTHNQIDNYVDIEKKYNAKSEYYFICGQKHRLGKRYELSEISSQISKLKQSSNFIIGIHTNYFSYNDEKRINEEIKEIENYTGTKVKSCRNHYLRFSIPTSWHVLKNVGINCDSTLGYSDKNGFRAATVQSFLPYDINKNEIIDIYEVPLGIMDGIIMVENISFDEKWLKIKYILDQCIKYNGTISILWHDYVIAKEDWKNMYIKIIEYIISEQGAFVISNDFELRKEQEKNDIMKLFSYIE